MVLAHRLQPCLVGDAGLLQQLGALHRVQMDGGAVIRGRGMLLPGQQGLQVQHRDIHGQCGTRDACNVVRRELQPPRDQCRQVSGLQRVQHRIAHAVHLGQLEAPDVGIAVNGVAQLSGQRARLTDELRVGRRIAQQRSGPANHVRPDVERIFRSRGFLLLPAMALVFLLVDEHASLEQRAQLAFRGDQLPLAQQQVARLVAHVPRQRLVQVDLPGTQLQQLHRRPLPRGVLMVFSRLVSSGLNRYVAGHGGNPGKGVIRH